MTGILAGTDRDISSSDGISTVFSKTVTIILCSNNAHLWIAVLCTEDTGIPVLYTACVLLSLNGGNGDHIPLYLVSYYPCCGECRNLCFLYHVHIPCIGYRFLCALYQVLLSCSGGYSFTVPLLQVYPNIL
jgi:hypothetical protein